MYKFNIFHQTNANIRMSIDSTRVRMNRKINCLSRSFKHIISIRPVRFYLMTPPRYSLSSYSSLGKSVQVISIHLTLGLKQRLLKSIVFWDQLVNYNRIRWSYWISFLIKLRRSIRIVIALIQLVVRWKP